MELRCGVELKLSSPDDSKSVVEPKKMLIRDSSISDRLSDYSLTVESFRSRVVTNPVDENIISKLCR